MNNEYKTVLVIETPTGKQVIEPNNDFGVLEFIESLISQGVREITICEIESLEL